MPEQLSWSVNGNMLNLNGVLTDETLLKFWHRRETLMNAVDVLNVTKLDYIDSAGLAMIVELIASAEKCGEHLKIKGVTAKLNTLIVLYNLSDLLRDNVID